MIDNNALFKLSYGLYVLTAKCEGKDNGCIVNTVIQITDTPKRIMVAVNKANFTCRMIKETNEFTVSCLTQKTSFDVIKRFGFASGRNVNKFENFSGFERGKNSIVHITENTNAFINAKVFKTEDVGTHIIFYADVTDAQTLSGDKSLTYDYYFENVKPKAKIEKKKGFVCKICGYVYEGETLPDDFICPLCKHGAEDFEPIGE